MVGGHQLGRGLLAIGKRDQNRRRLLHEIERAGNDVAVGRNHEAGRRAVGEQRASTASRPPIVRICTTESRHASHGGANRATPLPLPSEGTLTCCPIDEDAASSSPQ